MIAAQHAPAPASYKVRPGDTLSGIALSEYGNASDYPWIAAYNASVKNPNLIYAGDTLQIPSASTIAPGQVPPAPVYTPKHTTDYTPRHAAPTPVYTPAHAASGNMVQIASYLENHGGTRAGAAGVAACVWGESEGNPESVGSGGFGLIGWTGNTSGLPAGYYGPTGNVTADMDTQLAGVVGYIDAEGGWGPINSAPDALHAAWVFSENYERPAVTHSDVHADGGPGDPTAIFDAL
jgi:hypothetical protein